MFRLLRRVAAAVGAASSLALLSIITSGGVAAAGAHDLQSGPAAHVTLGQIQADGSQGGSGSGASGPGGNGQGGNGQGGNGQGDNGQGQGTATPELPSGVLFGTGLLPLAIGVLWRRRRARSARS